MSGGAPGWPALFATFGRIGVLSFGGPAAQIALMHRELVAARGWLSEKEYLSALSFCMLLPGPEAMQLATYSGWRLKGVPGGLLAGTLFVAPGAVVILALGVLYAYLGAVPLVQMLFLGVQAAVVAIVIEALLRVARKALKGWLEWTLAGAAFLGIFALGLPFPAIIIGAALIGGASVPQGTEAPPPPDSPIRADTARTVAIWGALWLLPLAGLWLFEGGILTAIGLFFAKLAVVTFGGAYAVLAYMTQEVVQNHGWLTTEEMVDGLGLAETTPGPLILVTQFVGFLAAFREGGLALGVAGALVALWMTFTPCFLWIFAGAPWIERITSRPRPAAALRGVTAAVVGVILNLSLWFTAHVFFARVAITELGPISVIAPDPYSIDLPATGVAVIAALLIFRLHWSLPAVLAVSAALGVAVSALI